MKRLTAATVHCNTPELLAEAIGSIKEFYPGLSIMIIDGSSDLRGFSMIGNKYSNISFGHTGYNIGHGPGMNMAIKTAESDYLLLFDTDIVMKKSCLEEMLELFEDDTFGVGEVNEEEQRVYHLTFGDGKRKIPVLHPYFHIVQRKEYFKYLPYVQNGGPVFLTALDIFSQHKSDKILKNFPVRNYIEHRWRGTRDVNPPDLYKNSVVLNEYHVERFRQSWSS